MSTVRETEIERQAVHRIALLGVQSTKMGTLYSTGWPDRLFFIPGGKPLMIEFKRPGEPATRKQEYIHEMLRKEGYDVEIHTTVDDAVAAVVTRLRKRKK